ncbi:hypothetical protein CC78DRAFT_598295 [Lojkania enalia]|uniref:Uncharacterized protein n=1 Tax=Lojkania enalia TaxID=147567 RepID=A0A9P4N745_9PLEO|nr:hypothetical protein CC78DRAFT_598295 [Didymosphaeria enalia]
MDLDLEEREPTVLEYSRFHGLTRNFSLEQLGIIVDHAPSSDDIERDLMELTEDILPNPADELSKERLGVSKDAALFLKAIQSLRQQSENEHLIADNRKRILNLKMEIPILRSDNELDLQDFGSLAIPSFNKLSIPFETVDEEKDEGLEWPSRYYAFPAKCKEQVKAEKITVSKDVLFFLQAAVNDSYTLLDAEKIKAESLTYNRNPALEPLTPPLLPVSPPFTPYIPSSPGNRLELLSESPNSVAAEAKMLEERIMEEPTVIPQLVREGSDASDPMLFEGDDLTQAFDLLPASLDIESPRIMKRKIEDLKVECPLTPPLFPQSPMKKLKSVSFPEIVHEYIPELPSNFESGDDILSPNDSFADFFKDVAPAVEEVNRKLENEKLSEVDTTMRVDVPILDFSLPTAPWEISTNKKTGKQLVTGSELEAQREFLLQVKREYLKPDSSWHGVSKLERDMHWSPFPSHMATIMISESLKDDGGVLEKLMAELTIGDIMTSSTNIWKREGLRILDYEEDSDEEIELSSFTPTNDMEALIRKRKIEIDDEEADEEIGRTNTQGQYMLQVSSKRNPPSQEPQPATSQAEISHPQPQQSLGRRDDDIMFGGMFSASTALHKFMAIHGKLPAKVVDGGRKAYEDQIMQHATSGFSAGLTEASKSAHSDAPTGVALQDHPESSEMLPFSQKLPPVPRILSPCSFIISSTLLQQRRLTRQIENFYSNAEFIERDFSLPHSPAKEADLLLSPSTGLIFTTLQNIKQQALPGQPNHSPIRERISELQHRYERLVVLVSEGLNKELEESSTGRLTDSRDIEALMDLKSFGTRMEAEILVRYVKGGEQVLSRIVVGEMAKWGLPHGSKDIGELRLLQEETLWELFLRRTGLNPFAAQVTLASLKNSYNLPLTSSLRAASNQTLKTVSVFGLPAFILMPAIQRIEKFQVLLGGSRILSRVSEVLDQQWPSAVHGFDVV